MQHSNEIRATARQMRANGMTLATISQNLRSGPGGYVSIFSVYNWTKDIAHPNRRSTSNFIFNGKKGIVGRFWTPQQALKVAAGRKAR